MKVHGYDYAIKPIIVIVGDTQFVELLNRGFVGLAYATVPQFGLLVNAPALTMIFEKDDIARECFEHFLSWKGDSNDGDSLQISFVEFEDGEFGMCTSQNIEKLIKRAIPKDYKEEFEPRIMIVGHIKMFPKISDGYLWFKSKVRSSPFIIEPASKQTPPNGELAMYKREINFYKEKEVPEHTVEGMLINGRNRTEERSWSQEIPSNIRFGTEGFIERRWTQLRRFFPVTVERLGFNNKFGEIKIQLLNEGYRDWQIVQGACNISLKNYAPELFVTNSTTSEESHEEQSNSSTSQILIYLLNNSENVNISFPSDDKLSLEKLREQIDADSFELLCYFKETRQMDVQLDGIQDELAKSGLLDN